VEHIYHIFGGGCGEHLIWSWFATFGSGGAIWFTASKTKGNE